jgi:hypothetical protein
MHVATIIHLTDLHLFVDEEGDPREVSERRGWFRLQRAVDDSSRRDPRHWLTRAISRTPHFGHGVDFASESAWRALTKSLEPLLTEPVPLVVLQTGDVEAFGSGWTGSTGPFPGFTALKLMRSQLRTGDTWIDIYGNHDVWFGAPPIAGVTASGHVTNCLNRIAGVEGLAGGWPEYLAPIRTRHPDVDLDVLRLNTVLPSGVGAFLARGRVLRHLPPAEPTGADTTAALRDIVDKQPARGRPTIRIAMLHHPVHRFAAGPVKTATTGWLIGRRRLGDRLGRVGVHAVIAGHRHSLDPAQGATVVRQAPLSEGIVQFVADTPTQDTETHLRTFSIYRLYVDDALTTLTMRRHLARRPNDTFERFELEASPDVTLSVPL